MPADRTTTAFASSLRPSRRSCRTSGGCSWRRAPPKASCWNAPPCPSSPSSPDPVARWRSGCCWDSWHPPSWCGGVHVDRGRQLRRLSRGPRCHPRPDQPAARPLRLAEERLTRSQGRRSCSQGLALTGCPGPHRRLAREVMYRSPGSAGFPDRLPRHGQRILSVSSRVGSAVAPARPRPGVAVARRPGDAAGEPKVPGPALPLLAPDPKGGQHEPRLIALLCAATARWCQLGGGGVHAAQLLGQRVGPAQLRPGR